MPLKSASPRSAGSISWKGTSDMSYSHEEIEILVLETALDAAREHSARMKRRMVAAEDKYWEAVRHERGLRETIQQFREAYLRRTV